MNKIQAYSRYTRFGVVAVIVLFAFILTFAASSYFINKTPESIGGSGLNSGDPSVGNGGKIPASTPQGGAVQTFTGQFPLVSFGVNPTYRKENSGDIKDSSYAVFSKPDGQQKIVVRVLPMNEFQSIVDYGRENVRFYGEQAIDERQFSVQDFSAARYSVVSRDGATFYHVVFIKTFDRAHLIQGNGTLSGGNGDTVRRNVMDDVNQVLSTYDLSVYSRPDAENR